MKAIVPSIVPTLARAGVMKLRGEVREFLNSKVAPARGGGVGMGFVGK